MVRFFLPVLVAVVCLLKSTLQIVAYVHYPDLLVKMPPLAFFASNANIVLYVVAAYLAIQKPRLAALVLILILLIHLVLFPLGVVISRGVVLGVHYWQGFMISVSSNAVVALLAYASWRISRSKKAEIAI